MGKKALGIVRRMDDLGRVVVPMEVRKVRGWEAGTPIEMFSDENGLYLREYGRDREVQEIIDKLCAVDNEAPAEVKEALTAARDYIMKIQGGLK
ncbi:AbrB/MazE/SpoVT family DNA-binding domain-containing protein [Terribacillus saccharophilus]|uniref:AbrB/MazE/SpoVT family DNA-binding domain-containing protein n=1 Tax=Terribacillus saccharophilus TaxID=361277 RepID=UPI000BA68051|nr:AbrB/MazE/SpoVT family DNA-binding domain-containing protein [Terribacillus saccharophilus]PAF15928.1 AbrB family transcriptional regulator [Terribacillus saccharophilus]